MMIFPALDNDDYRRGRLTTHEGLWRGYGYLKLEYALLNYAYETACCRHLPWQKLFSRRRL